MALFATAAELRNALPSGTRLDMVHGVDQASTETPHFIDVVTDQPGVVATAVARGGDLHREPYGQVVTFLNANV